MSDESNQNNNHTKQTVANFINPKTIIAFIAGIALTLLVVFIAKPFSSTEQSEEGLLEYETLLDLSQYIPDINPSWDVTSTDPSVSEIKFESGHGFDGRNMILYFHKVGANDFTFTSPSGETYTYTINIDEEKNISVYRR